MYITYVIATYFISFFSFMSPFHLSVRLHMIPAQGPELYHQHPPESFWRDTLMILYHDSRLGKGKCKIVDDFYQNYVV